jgi:hypothetical protein
MAVSMKRRGCATTYPSRKAKGQLHPVRPASFANGGCKPSPRPSSRRLGSASRRIGRNRYSEDDGSGTSLTGGTTRTRPSSGPWYLTIAPLEFKPGTWEPFPFDAFMKRGVQICESDGAVSHNQHQRCRLILPGAFSV